ncbi:MAG: DUF5131 family protein [Richelia sp. SL_2_1]|nr:DUF5131 family protein [Richelia sp. SL_2_1]
MQEADIWRGEAWEIIKNTPEFIYQILTKRPERILGCLPSDWEEGYPNVWLGTSVENNDTRHRIEILSTLPAAVRFVSFEPLLEYVDLNFDLSTQMRIDWAIFGGESGNETGKYRYRPCEVEWMAKMIGEIRVLTPVFVKQMGTHLSKQLGMSDRHGSNIEEFPIDLQIRDMPYKYA